MPQIVPQSQFNRASQVVDDLYVILVPPGPTIIRGVPTNIAGIVGSASWGPLNQVIQVGSPQEAPLKVGFVANDAHDIATAIEIASQQGASDFRCVRVGDGAEAAATCTIMDVATPTPAILVTLTAKYTGTLGNNLRVNVTDGSQYVGGAKTCKVTIELLNVPAAREIYDNLPITAAAFKTAIASAITNGQGPTRPPSQLVASVADGAGTANIDVLTDADSLYSFSGGLNGSSGLVDSDLIGDAATVTGMYRLENTGVSQFILFGHTTASDWTTIDSFAKSNGMLGVVSFAAAKASATAISDKNTAGVDTYALLILKDHVLWDDRINNLRRLLTPDAAALGLIAVLSPSQGVGNKQISGLVGTERTRDQQPYTRSEIASLTTAGINFITNPVPGGNYFGLRHSQNASSDGNINGVNYTRMTNFLAASLAANLGRFVGLLQSQQPLDQTREDARASLVTFLQKLKQNPASGGAGLIDDFTLVLDKSNNDDASISQGYMNANAAVRYLSVIRFFNISLQAGQTVVTVSAQQA